MCGHSGHVNNNKCDYALQEVTVRFVIYDLLLSLNQFLLAVIDEQIMT